MERKNVSNSKSDFTIYDIAEQLGISASTVSRALNNHPSVSAKTRERIQSVSKKIGYQKNNFAKNLRIKKTHSIGVIVHELNSHFIISVLNGIESVTTAAGYNLVIGHSDEQNKREIANATNFFNTRVDGIIAALASDTKDLSHYDPFFQKNIPVVFFDRVKTDSDGIKVIINNEKAGYDATTHLIEQGCKRIIHVTGSLMRNVYADRLSGFRRAIQEHQLLFTEDDLFEIELGERASLEVADQIMAMEPKPDGIFFTNDLWGSLCMQRLIDRGVRVPDDIAVIGFNDDIICRVVKPTLSTVRYDGREIGQVAGERLIDLLKKNNSFGNSPSYQNSTLILQHKLIVRESSIKNKTFQKSH